MDGEINFEDLLRKVHSDDREQVRQVVRAGNDLNVEYRIVLPDSSTRWIISRGQLHAETPGEPPHLMGVSTDITERKRTEESLKKAYDEINRLREQLEAENIYLRE